MGLFGGSRRPMDEEVEVDDDDDDDEEDEEEDEEEEDEDEKISKKHFKLTRTEFQKKMLDIWFKDNADDTQIIASLMLYDFTRKGGNEI